MSEKIRMTVVFEGLGIMMRIVPHTTDDEKIMIKTEKHMAPALAFLFGTVGLETTGAGVGANWALLECELGAFMKALPQMAISIQNNGPTIRSEFLETVTMLQNAAADEAEPVLLSPGGEC